ncbi:hypothetical protein Poli38472_002308 [Pythium oligandrum]|uniref:Protein kinase domain-containing protein n=1 Tax=Pythium oligandrum TaxID=41045 RepID=A0A8K1CHA3_PYTOL|nr:hypothetical protein Poli38472_002308 [Pythium oligandrum]|eukprot:TMW63367.1 hypothetical protein Poli38472_002308 [Pythium oligandrum]
MEVPHTFVRTVKAADVCFDHIDDVIETIRHKKSPVWAIFAFTDHHKSRNTLRTIAKGDGDLSDQSLWPRELFATNALCYGFSRVDFPEDDSLVPGFVSFCWKGRSLPIYLRTKYAEFNHVIRKHLAASMHVTLQNPEELVDGTVWKHMPPTPRRKRSGSRRFATNDIEFAPDVLQAVKEIRSDAAPFNWIVCGYEMADVERINQRIIVVEKGMSGLQGLKGLGGITAVLKEGCTMYIYLRVDIPLHNAIDRIMSKFVLVTWQGSDANGLYSDDEFSEPWSFPSSSDGPPLSTSSTRDGWSTPTNSKVQRVVTAHLHGSEIYRFFPHHVHFCANTIDEITEESIRDRIRRAIDNDCMLLRVVCIQRTGDVQSPACVEVPLDATVGTLRKEIASFVGIPENQQQIVWIRQMDEFVNDLERSTRAISLDDDNAALRKDIGLSHGDKIHVGDSMDGEESILDKLVKQINSGVLNVSLSAERRHEVQQGVEAREAELQLILTATHDKIRRRASRREMDAKSHPPSAPSSPVSKPVPAPSLELDPAAIRKSITTQLSTISDDSSQDDVSNLQEQARVLEEQNEYLEIPYDSIRILNGKENELGCGKAATVYRGLWMNKNGAAEVAIKLFRYVRLTDKILGDYTKEVALLRKLKHPNIVLFIGACTDPKLMILTEYCSRKSLYEVIHSNNFTTIPWQYKVRMMLDAARGIQYLHSKRIIHRDIKSHNFLVDDDWRVKVADFGISKVLENDANAFTQCGTTGWVAPEVLLDEDLGYTFKADNWSFAIVMWEMVADGNQNPFIGMAPIKFYNQTVHSGIRPPLPEGVDPEYVGLINDCWHSNASDRPSFTEIVSRLEQILLKLGANVDLPPAFQGGYHHALSAL